MRAILSKYRILSIFATAVVLTAILMPGRDVPDVGLPGIDKLVHLLMFGCWSLALRFDFPALPRQPALFLAIGACAALGSETLQIFAEGRSFDLVDAAFDLTGIGLVVVFGGPAVGLMKRILGPRDQA